MDKKQTEIISVINEPKLLLDLYCDSRGTPVGDLLTSLISSYKCGEFSFCKSEGK